MKKRSEGLRQLDAGRSVKRAATGFALLLAIGGLGLLKLFASLESSPDFKPGETRPVQVAERPEVAPRESAPASARPVDNSLDAPEIAAAVEFSRESIATEELREKPAAAPRPPHVLRQLSNAPRKGARATPVASGTLRNIAEAIRRDDEIRARGETPFVDAPAPRMLVPPRIPTAEDRALLAVGQEDRAGLSVGPDETRARVSSAVSARPSVFGALTADVDSSSAGFSPLSATPKSAAPSPAPPAFAGGFLAKTSGSQPPDTNGAVGPNHLIVALNSGITIQSKEGVEISSVSLSSFWSPLGSAVFDRFDPKVIYDPLAGRFIMVANANRRDAASGVLLAVSASSDPTGSWHQWLFDADSANSKWADFPYIGMTQDKITFTTNMFSMSNSFQGSNIWVSDKSTALDGGAITTALLYNAGRSAPVPALTYDAGETTEYMLSRFFSNYSGIGYLELSFISGTASSPSFNITSAAVAGPPWNSSNPKAPQAGSSSKINTNDDRTQNVVLRNGRLWTTHHAALPASGTATITSAQWWDINPLTAAVFQTGRVFGSDPDFFAYYPSIAVNANNEALVGFSGSSVDVSVGAYFVQRDDTMPLGTMGPITAIREQTGLVMSKSRWGDYSATHVDPVDDTTMWTIQLIAGASNTYTAWWGKFGEAVGGGGEDTTKPEVSGASVLDSSTVRVTFNEAMQEDAALTNKLYYQFSGGPPTLGAASVTRVDATSVDVTVDPSMWNLENYTVTVLAGPSDISGNTVDTSNNDAVFVGVSTTVQMTSTSPSSTNDNPIPVTVTFSEAVTGFSVSDIVTSSNASASSLSGSGSVYTFNLVPNSDGLITADIGANAAQDAASNGNRPGVQFTRVYDGTRPVPTLSYDNGDPGITNDTSFAVTAEFSEAVTGFTSSDVNPTNATVSGFSEVSSTEYTFNLVPSNLNGVGGITAEIPANAAKDALDNNSVASNSLPLFTYDGMRPSVSSISFDKNTSGLTNDGDQPVTVVFSESIFGLALGEIVTSPNATVSGLSTVGPTVKFTVTANFDGLVTVSVPGNVATDLAGNLNTGSVERSFTLDSVRPSPELSFLNGPPGITGESSHSVTVSFDEAVTGFTLADIAPSGNAVASGFSTVSSSEYTFDLAPINTAAGGEITAQVNANAAQDAALNQSQASNQISFTYDASAPSPVLTFVNGSPGLTNAASLPVPVRVEFGEAVTGFTIEDITPSGNASASGFSTVSSSEYTFNLAPINSGLDGTITARINANVAQDLALIQNEASNEISFDYDGTAPAPVLSFVNGSPGLTNAASLPVAVRVEFGEAVTGFTLAGIAPSPNAVASGLNTVTSSEYTFNLAPIDPAVDGTIAAQIDANAALDLALNQNEASNGISFDYDGTAPGVIIEFIGVSPDMGATTEVSPLPFRVTFDEVVFGFDEFAMSLTSGTLVSNFASPDNQVFTFELVPSASGTQTVNIPMGAATDAAGNDSSAASPLAIDFITAFPIAQLSFTFSDPSPTKEPLQFVTLQFSEDVTGVIDNTLTPVDLDPADLTVTFLEAVTAQEYNFSILRVSPPAGAIETVRVSVGAGVVSDNLPSNILSFVLDNEPPAPTLSFDSLAPGSSTNVQSHPATVTFSGGEAVTGFDASDIVTPNGSVASFDGANNPTFTFNLMAAAEGSAVTASILDGAAVDTATNQSTASNEISFTFDNTGPVLESMEFDTGGSEFRQDQSQTATVTFGGSEPVTGFEIGDIQVTGGSVSIDGVNNPIFVITLTATAEGEAVTAAIGVEAAQDAAGNLSVGSAELTFTWDQTQPIPTLSFVNEAPGTTDAGTTGAASQRVRAEFDEPITFLDPEAGLASIANVTGGAIENLDDSGSPVFFFDLAADANQTATLSINAGLAPNAAQDAAGNLNAASAETLSFTHDGTPPTALIAFTNGQVGGATNLPTHEVTVTLADSQGITAPTLLAENIGTTNGALVAATGNPAPLVFTFNVTAQSQGEVSIFVPMGVVQDDAGNGNAASNSVMFTFDSVGPTPQFFADFPNGPSARPGTITLDFGEPVAPELSSAPFSPDGATVLDFASDGSGQVYTFKIEPNTEPDTISVALAAGAVADPAGNLNAAASIDLFFPNDNPTVVLSSTVEGLTGIQAVPVTATFSESVTGFATDDVVLTNAGITEIVSMGDGRTYTFNVTPVADGLVSARVKSGAAQDSVNNLNNESNLFEFTFDGTKPTLALSSVEPPTTGSPDIAITAQFSEPVTGFTLGDISVVNSLATVSGLTMTSPSGDAFAFFVTPQAPGETITIEIEVAPGSYSDEAGNSNTDMAQFSIDSDLAAPLVLAIDIDPLAPSPNNLAEVTFDVTFSEPVTGVDLGPAFTGFRLIDTPDGSLPEAAITSITGGGSAYQVSVAPGFGIGALRLDLVYDDSTSIQDGVGRSFEAEAGAVFAGQSYDIDRLIPSIAISGPSAPITTNGPVEFIVTYSNVATIALMADDIVILAEEGGCLECPGTPVEPVTTANRAGAKGTSPPPFINAGAPVGVVTVSDTANEFEKVVTVSDISGDGFLSIVVPGSSGQSASGEPAIDTIGPSVQVDNTAPTIAVDETDPAMPVELFTLVGPALTNQDFGAFSVTFSESIDFTEALVELTGSLGGAATFTLTQADPDLPTYVVTATPNDPDADGTLAMNVLPFADQAGNLFTGASSPESFTFDNTPPSIAIAGPSVPGAVSGPVDYTVTYADANGVGQITLSPGQVELIVTGTAAAEVSIIQTNIEIANERAIRLSNVSGIGTIAVAIGAGTAQDTVGNVALASAVSATVDVDSTPLVASIGTPSVDATVSGPVTYDIGYSGATEVTLAAADVTLNRSGSANATVSVQGSGTAARQVVLTNIVGEGTISISIDGGTAVNAVGGTHEPFGPSAAFVSDKTAPGVEIGAPSMMATTDQPVTFGVAFSGADQIDFGTEHVLLTSEGNASASPTVTRINETQFNVTLNNISGNGALTLVVAAGAASDAAGNQSASSAPSATISVDTIVPSVTVQQAASQPDPAEEFPIFFDIVFSEAVTGFGPEDVEFGGTFATGQIDFTLTGSGMAYALSVDLMPGEGAVAVFVAAGVATDAAGNLNTGFVSTDNIVLYTPPPCMVTSIVLAAPANGESITVSTDTTVEPTAYSLVAETDCADDTLDVTFFVDGVEFGVATDMIYTFTIDDLLLLGLGDHTVTAVVTSLANPTAPMESPTATITLVESGGSTSTKPGKANGSTKTRKGGKKSLDSGGKAVGEIPATLSFPSTDDPNVQITVSAPSSLLEEGETGTLIVLLGADTEAVLGPEEASQLAAEPGGGLVAGGEYVEVSVLISADGVNFEEIPNERLLENPILFTIDGINVVEGGFAQLYSHPTMVDTAGEFEGIDVFAEAGSWTTDHVRNLVLTDGTMSAELIGLSIFAPFNPEMDSNANISVQPTSLDFGSAAVGSSVERDFTVWNLGDGTLTGVVTVPAPFEVVSGAAYSLGAFEFIIVSIRFSPTSSGGVSEFAEFSGGGGGSSFLTAQGTAAPGAGCASTGVGAPFANYMGDMLLVIAAAMALAGYSLLRRKNKAEPQKR